MVFPYLSNGDLCSYVQFNDSRALPETQVASFLMQMTQGLLFMKEHARLAHHDVSLENTMLDGDGNVYIIDLGMCLHVPDDATHLAPMSCAGKPGE